MKTNNKNTSYTPKHHIRRHYKKPKTKAEVQADRQARIFNKFRDYPANCGEDKILQSFQVRYKDHISMKEELGRSRWQGINRTLLEQSLVLNGALFIPNPDGCKDWPKARHKYKHKYISNGVELGISNGNRWEVPTPGTIPNIISRMGPEALVHDLDVANKFLSKALEGIVDKFWCSWLTGVDAHIDIPIPFELFYKQKQAGMFTGQIGRKKQNQREYATAYPEGIKIIHDGETIHFNINGDIDVVLYDKKKEFLQEKSGKKLELYLKKFGELPVHLTRIEIRLKRDYLKKAGKGGIYAVWTVDDWQYFKASIINEVMTKKFYFIEKDGSIMPEWSWARHKYLEWAKDDISKSPIEHVATKSKVKPDPISYIQSMKRGLGTLRTAMIKEHGILFDSPEQFLQELTKKALHPKLKDKVFTHEFFQKGENTFLKEKSQYDNSDIHESIFSGKGILNLM